MIKCSFCVAWSPVLNVSGTRKIREQKCSNTLAPCQWDTVCRTVQTQNHKGSQDHQLGEASVSCLILLQRLYCDLLAKECGWMRGCGVEGDDTKPGACRASIAGAQ